MSDVQQHNPTWSGPERFAFRAAFAYAVMFAVTSLLDVADGPRRLLASIRDPLVGWFSRVVFGLSGAPNYADTAWTIAYQVFFLLAALIVAAVWSLLSRRSDYERLHGWTRIVIRYYVAVVMLIYGSFKVINTQFPPPSLEQLNVPLGALSPMALLWTFMGYSTLYTSFAGMGEVVGAVLLFFRRTTTLGALIIIGVMSNVALMNYAYDVPVKQLSVNLLLAAIALALPDARRLLAVLVLNRPSQPANLEFTLPRWIERVRRFLKPAIVIGATCLPLALSWRFHGRLRETGPLFGMYDVERFTRNGESAPPVLTDSARWRTVVFGRPGSMSIRLMSDSLRVMGATIDTTARRVTIRSRTGPPTPGSLVFERIGSEGLRVIGVDGRDSVDVLLKRVDHQKRYRLARAQSWLELPPNQQLRR